MLKKVTDRRVRVRTPCSLRVLCAVQSESGRRQVVGTATNLSRRGVALVLPCRLARDETILIRLERLDNGFSCESPASVQHDQPVSSGWMVGCQFHEPLSTVQFCGLLKRALS